MTEPNNSPVFSLVIGLVVVVVLLALLMPKRTTQVMNCIPFVGNSLNTEDLAKESMANVYSDSSFFDADKLKPNPVTEDSPDWVKSFAEGNDNLLQQNFIDTTNMEKFQVAQSACGKRYMSRDLRRVPTINCDPSTVNIFGLPNIDSACLKEFNESRPSLDCM